MSGVVVVGVDGSPGAQKALRWAAREARLRQARLRVVMAWSYLKQPDGAFDPDYGEDDARRQADAALGADGEGIEVEAVPVCDLPARALLQSAADADLVVVGARGVGGFKGLLLGSVSQQVAQRAPCPVVIARGEERSASS